MLTCAYGTPWGLKHDCVGCTAASARLSELFDADVQAGRCDRWGYTPAEAKHRPITQLDLELARV